MSTPAVNDHDVELFGWALGAVIEQLRKRAARGQVELAKACEISQAAISRIETGDKQPTAYVYERLARALETTTADIAERTRATVAACALVAETLQVPSEALFEQAVVRAIARAVLTAKGS